jgi:hypothetical protein
MKGSKEYEKSEVLKKGIERGCGKDGGRRVSCEIEEGKGKRGEI